MRRFRFLNASVFVIVWMLVPHHDLLTRAADNTCSVEADAGEVRTLMGYCSRLHSQLLPL